MGNLTEFFERTIDKPRYRFGDRVSGVYQGVPFVGTVGVDNIRNAAEGPMVMISLDLPLRLKSGLHLTLIRVQYKNIRSLRKTLEI